MTTALFIYGTLKRGFHNFDAARTGAIRDGFFHTIERYPLHITGPWGAPVLINEPGQGHQVYGEIHDVTVEQLLWFDEFEGCHLSHGYDRIKIHVADGSNGLVTVDVYMKPRARIEAVRGEPLDVYPRDADYILPSERG
jgi:gamma-glutamylaminecyclotransferase